MSSSVFFRFKSQKEPSRVTFDGTGISVFELKREIITANRLGDGTDFELVISAEDTNEDYNDDTTIIPRSSTVIAKRLPASKPGRGGAARYMSGKMPQTSKNSYRAEAPTSKPVNPARPSNVSQQASDTNGAQTEEEKIAAMFQNSANQWAAQQQEMANATPIYRGAPHGGKHANIPDHPPPPGYVCYRCGEKGHFIQACPTNDDPNFDGRPRIKRTTGIPRSFLKTIEKPSAIANDGTVDDTKQPSGVMVNAEGEWVIAEPDQASWDQYQAKAKVSAAAQQAAARGSKELQDRGLECPIDKRLFVEPTKTPCCQTTYCNECITNALLESGLTCPSCSTEDVVLDNLLPDEETAAKIRDYQEEKGSQKAEELSQTPAIKSEPHSDKERPASPKTKSKSPTQAKPEIKRERNSMSPKSANQPKEKAPSKETTPLLGAEAKSNSKKRPAEDELKSDRTPPAPSATSMVKQSSANGASSKGTQKPANTPTMSHNNQTPFSNGNYMMPQMMTGMPFPNMNGMNGFMGIPQMNTGLFDPSMMGTNSFMNPAGNWNMWSQALPAQNMGMTGAGFQNGMYATAGYNPQNMQMPMGNGYNNGMMMNNTSSMGGGGYGKGSFPNQQRNHLHGSNDEDSAYFRRPVNPHRHQARRNVNRPTDYREI
ncbi:MAG: hypothetical protein Q9191_002709 [Dirinaria sp. TL-2023a]